MKHFFPKRRKGVGLSFLLTITMVLSATAAYAGSVVLDGLKLSPSHPSFHATSEGRDDFLF